MYKVTKKFAKGPEAQIGVYKTLSEAKSIIQAKLAEDARHSVNATYCLYEYFDDLMEQFDQSKLVNLTNQQESSDAASQASSGQRASPTPFNMTPAPKGLPRSVTQEDDKDKK